MRYHIAMRMKNLQLYPVTLMNLTNMLSLSEPDRKKEQNVRFRLYQV